MGPQFYSLQTMVLRAVPLAATWPTWLDVRTTLAALADEENQ